MPALREFFFPYGRDIGLVDGYPVGLIDATGARVANPTLESAVQAAKVLTFAASPNDGDTVTMQKRDGTNIVYTFKTALTPTRGQVLIGADQDVALTNLGYAVNGTGTPGTHYAIGTPPMTDYAGTVDTGANTLTVNPHSYGDAWNTALGNFAESTATVRMSWGATTSGVDTPDFKEAPDFGTQANSSCAPIARNGIFVIVPTAPMLTCKRNHLEFDDDSGGGVFLRDDYCLVTTDHPAASIPNGAIYAGVLDAPTDLAADGSTVEIPNTSHGSTGDWNGDAYSVPDTDDIITGDWMYLFDPDTGDHYIAEIKSYDYDAGTGNQGIVTFTVGADIQIPTTLRAAGRLWYIIYLSNSTKVAELGTQAKADVNTEVDNALDTAVPGSPTANSVNERIVTMDNAIGNPYGIKKNTAFTDFVFHMVLASDHVSDATGKSVTATVSIDGAAFGAATNAVSEISGGWYKIDLDAADVNGDVIALRFTAAATDSVNILVVTGG